MFSIDFQVDIGCYQVDIAEEKWQQHFVEIGTQTKLKEGLLLVKLLRYDTMANGFF